MIVPISKNIELLVPARDYLFGRAAIDHGADAVYIGAPKYSARSAASNDILEIEKLIKYAHPFRAKVYAALNTILFDSEIEEALGIINSLHDCGIDGLIIQDMGLLELDLPPVPLIASTQTHNATAQKVKFLESVGFSRVILARELSLKQISEIRENTTVELESFVHGALCVSYSGQCYMSEAICQRSGNRGLCAQPCRSVYSLIDGKGEVLIKDKHLLSLKDLNLSAYISKMIDAGISSFKIEGRLKDITYVKNVTSYYRQIIDADLEKREGAGKTSSGIIYHNFTPDPERSFNRGFTQYFIEGRKEKTGSPDSQKSIGKRLGYVLEKNKNWIKIDSEDLQNGDGLCFFGNDGVLYGFAAQKVIHNKVFYKGNSLFDKIEIGSELYRNHDQQFEKLLNGNCAERKIRVTLVFKETPSGFILTATDEDNTSTSVVSDFPKTIAKNADQSLKSLNEQLAKSGNSIFEVIDIQVNTDQVYFFPVAIINSLRREIFEKLEYERVTRYKLEHSNLKISNTPYPDKGLTYFSNVSNQYARKFYENRNVVKIDQAIEITRDFDNKRVMTTKHCIRYQFEACPVYQKGKADFDPPLFLKDNHHTYKLEFDCKKCEMHVIFDK